MAISKPYNDQKNVTLDTPQTVPNTARIKYQHDPRLYGGTEAGKGKPVASENQPKQAQ